MTRQYFGTDGIRGRVGQPPMTPDFALRLGWAAGRVLAHEGRERAPKPGERVRVVIGKDTRLSGYMFESALESGLSAAGVDVLLVGPMPTPAIAYLTRTFSAAAGVVISASHNPYYDNGVKFFSSSGRKLPDAVEQAIEAKLDDELVCVGSAELGRARRLDSAPGRYIEFCKSTFRGGAGGLSGMRLAVDCAHGATYHVAPHVYRELGAEVDSMGDQPDGLNINRDCGSTHMEGLREKVRSGGYDAGIALDGDGDRCLMVTADGSLVDGDQLLYVIARARQRAGALQGPVVGTLMSNLGLELALADAGIAFERARVGDRYVFEMLMNSGGMLGGEASGHTLCLDRASTGDGIVSSLQVLEVMAATGASLAELIAEVRQCPQTLINVPLAGRSADDLMQAQSVMDAVAAEEQSLAASGRVLLRPSGTEPLLRVMVESTDAGASRDAAQRIAAAIETVAAGS